MAVLTVSSLGRYVELQEADRGQNGGNKTKIRAVHTESQ